MFKRRTCVHSLSMMFTAVFLFFNCLPGVRPDHIVSSSQGRFTLEVTNKSLTLREKWKLEASVEGTFVVADSGTWVAALNSPSGERESQLTLINDKGVPTEIRLLDVLSEEERQFLPWSDCGTGWLSSVKAIGDRLIIEVEQEGNRRPTEAPGPTLRLTVDGKTGKIERGPSVPRPTIAELISAHQQDTRPGRAFMLLRLKARLRSSQADRSLCDFFAGTSRSGDIETRRASIDALGEAGCRAELATITAAPPRGDEADLAVLEQLEQLPKQPGETVSAAEKYALAALTARRPPTLLRRRATKLLLADACPLRWEAAKLALADPDPTVRVEAAGEVGRLALSQEAFAFLLPAALSPGEQATQARYAVLRYFENGENRWRTQLIEAEAAGKLDRWPAAIVVVAGLTEVNGDQSRAETLYRRAAVLLDAQRPKQGNWADAQLWAEAKLRLAQLAANAGQKEAALRLANEVLTSGVSEHAAAPAPNRYAGGHAVQQASTIATALIKTGGAPLPDPNAAFKQYQDMMKLTRETQALIAEKRRLREEQRRDAGH